MFEKMYHRYKNSKGYTLMEVLTVVGIIVILCAIAIPSVMGMRSSQAQKQLDNYAKTIYMAAQSNLAEMRSSNKLGELQGASLPSASIQDIEEGKYVYVSSENSTYFDLVLPVNSVESVLRDKQIIIEFNPKSGGVYSVFYFEKEESLIDLYKAEDIRNEDSRKEYEVGYYNGSDLTVDELKIVDITPKLHFDRGEEGIVYIAVPMQKAGATENFVDNYADYAKDLEIKLSISDENGNIIEKVVTEAGEKMPEGSLDVPKADVTNNNIYSIFVPCSIDSLKDEEGFDDLVAVKDVSGNITGYIIAPGENISIVADVTYKPEDSATIFDIERAVMAGVNPMFDSLTITEDGKYILAVSNGRHLQNLSLLHEDIAKEVESVVFMGQQIKDGDVVLTENGIDWSAVISHYGDEAIYRPINHEILFGSETVKGSALVEGNGCKIYNLDINTDNINEEGEADNSDPLVGLFGYVNTRIDGLEIVNPKIEGGEKTGALAGAVGKDALLKDCGVYLDTAVTDFKIDNYFVKGHGAVGGLVGYAASDKDVEDIVDLSMTPEKINEELAKNELTKEQTFEDYISFYRCFAAVPVEGAMSTDANGYTNGVGGLVGNSQGANFYSCYASGAVTATEVIVQSISDSEINWDELLNEEILEEQKLEVLAALMSKAGEKAMGFKAVLTESQGVGGFVGTSNSSCYGNCFSTGNVSGDGEAAGGFVGLMNYNDGLFNQHTVFSSCYSVGNVTLTAEDGSQVRENFSGTNAGVMTGLSYADFYKLYALNDAVSSNSALDYQSPYIFKDSYYLNQALGAAEEFCASAERYSTFKTLHERSAAENTWTADSLTVLKNTPIISISLDQAKVEAMRANLMDENYLVTMDAIQSLIDETTGKKLLAEMIFEQVSSTATPEQMKELAEYVVSCDGDIRFDIFFAVADTMENDYPVLYKIGFSEDIWGKMMENGTFSYSNSEESYPFSMLKDMEYYGSWPEKNATAALAYYEAYHAMEDTYHYGFYYDKKETSTLCDTVSAASDGYAVIYNDRNTEEDSIMQLKDGSKYYYRFLTADEMKCEDKSFYTTLSVDSYNFKFNPNLALSHISTGNDSEPEVFYVRTARQLAALGTDSMRKYWSKYGTEKNKQHQFIQQTDIDFDKYDFATYEKQENWPIGPIGDSLNPFDNIYTAPVTKDKKDNDVVHYKKIIGYPYGEDGGIFSSIGSDGIVRGLIIEPVTATDDDTLDKDKVKFELNISTEAQSFGFLAGENHGQICDSSVILTGDVKINNTASSSKTGLLVGYSAGKLLNSHVIVPAYTVLNSDNEGINKIYDVHVDISATNAGLLAGSAEGSVENCSVKAQGEEPQNSKLHFTASGMSVGGLVGSTTAATLNNADVEITTMTANQVNYVGGLVGYAGALYPTEAVPKGSKFMDCDVKADIIINDNDFLNAGGLAGYSKNAEIGNCIVSGSIQKPEKGAQEATEAQMEVVVGGAVGYADKGVYDRVTATVDLNEAWSGSPQVELKPSAEGAGATEEILNPAGHGSIGLFAGHIEGGTFNDCSGLGVSGEYQFLGTAKASGKTTVNGAYYSNVKYDENVLKAISPAKLIKFAPGEGIDNSAYVFPMTLTNCTFVNGKGHYYQEIGGNVHFYHFTGKYELDEVEMYSEITLTEVEIDKLEELAKKALENNKDFVGWLKSDYYWYDSASKEYSPIYVTEQTEQYVAGINLETKQITGEDGVVRENITYTEVDISKPLYHIAPLMEDESYLYSAVRIKKDGEQQTIDGNLYVYAKDSADEIFKLRNETTVYTIADIIESEEEDAENVRMVQLKNSANEQLEVGPSQQYYFYFYHVTGQYSYEGSNDHITAVPVAAPQA